MSYTTPHYYPKYEILRYDDYLANGPFNLPLDHEFWETLKAGGLLEDFQKNTHFCEWTRSKVGFEASERADLGHHHQVSQSEMPTQPHCGLLMAKTRSSTQSGSI